MDKQENQQKFTPFSKKNVIYARAEAYVFSLILIVMVWLEKDVSAIAILLSLAWGGYKGLQCFYIWLCKHERLYEYKLKCREMDLDTNDIEDEINQLNNEEINTEDY